MEKLIICLLIGLGSSAWAQVATTGQIVGSIQDPSGAAVLGATLRLENENTKEAQTTTSGADGGFVFPTVMPGSYSLIPGLTARPQAVVAVTGYAGSEQYPSSFLFSR